MGARLPGPRTHDTPEHYGFGVLTRTRRRTDDPVGLARRLVADGCRVAVEPGTAHDAAELVDDLAAAGIGPECELDLAVDRWAGARLLGVDVALAGPREAVDELAAVDPRVRAVVVADEPGAEARCGALASRRVRLVRGRRGSDRAFVRCLNLLMAGGGHPGIAATDPRLIAIAGERAAWNGRTPDSWEHVLPYGTRTEERQRLVAAGCTVRVVVRSGRGRA
jgi:proline dehydrogenase